MGDNGDRGNGGNGRGHAPERAPIGRAVVTQREDAQYDEGYADGARGLSRSTPRDEERRRRYVRGFRDGQRDAERAAAVVRAPAVRSAFVEMLKEVLSDGAAKAQGGKR